MRSSMGTGRGARADTADTTESGARRRRRFGRQLATVTASCVLAAGFLAAPVAGLPGSGIGDDAISTDQGSPDFGAGSQVGEGVSVGVVGTSTSTSGAPTTVAEVLGVLERAELAAKDAGRAVTPQVEQAAAELGMLLSTYLAQEAEKTAEQPFAAADHTEPTPVVVETGPETAPEQAEEPSVAEDVEVMSVSRDVASEPGTVDADVPEAAVDAGDLATHDGAAVTFDDVLVAATRLATLLDPAMTTLEGGILPAGTDGITAARATLTAGLLQVVDKYGKSTAGYANGQIPTSALCPLDFAPGHMLRCDAAAQLTALSAEYEKEFGVPIPMTDSYRTYASQVRLKATKGYLAATPGTSNHGWGLAVDLSTPISTGTSAEYTWMRVHAPDYGWDNPSWARFDGSKPEPWHFEFFAAGPIPDRAWKAADVDSWGAGGGTGSGDASDAAAERTKEKERAKDSTSTSTSTSKAVGKSPSDQKDSSKDKGSNPSKGGTTPDKGDPKPGETAKPKVTVPDVAGRTLATATAKLEKLGLKVTTKTAASDEAKGQVLETQGAGTKVSKGATITLVVSSGPVKVAVPKVVGEDKASAKQALENAGLIPQVVKKDSDQPEGVVLWTNPAAGKSVAAGSTVTVAVSSGPAKVEVPDVTGWTVADARAELKARGFVVVMDPAEGVEDDDLIVTTKGAGTAVPKGSTVVLSWGEAESIPDVAGKTVADARAELAALGFEVSTDPAEGVKDDAVVAETVGAQTRALKGSTVTLVVAKEDG